MTQFDPPPLFQPRVENNFNPPHLFSRPPTYKKSRPPHLHFDNSITVWRECQLTKSHAMHYVQVSYKNETKLNVPRLWWIDNINKDMMSLWLTNDQGQWRLRHLFVPIDAKWLLPGTDDDGDDSDDDDDDNDNEHMIILTKFVPHLFVTIDFMVMYACIWCVIVYLVISFIHSFILDISIVHLQVHYYYSEVFLTTALILW